MLNAERDAFWNVTDQGHLSNQKQNPVMFVLQYEMYDPLKKVA